MRVKNQEEKGYALVITMAILMGMLIMITPLVLMNNQRSKEVRNRELNVHLHYGMGSAKGIAEYLNKKNGRSSISSFAKTAFLPGWRDVPLRLRCTQGGSIAGVANILPAFLMMSEPLAKLSVDITETDHVPNINRSGAWLIIDGELMGSGSHRGLAGVLSSHRKGTIVYGLANEIDDGNLGYVKVKGKWAKVTGWTLDNDHKLTGKLSLSALSEEFENPKNGNVIEFYPALPRSESVLSSSSNLIVDIHVGMEDERSKINVNSFSKNLANNALKLNIDHPKNAGFPFESPMALKSAGVNSSKLRSHSEILTVFSTPDYSDQALSPFNPMSEQLLSADGTWGGGEKAVYQHPININTASISVLGLSFKVMGIENPYRLARMIMEYRSGESKKDNLNGRENPFDGFNLVTEIHYSSAAEEFRDFIEYAVASVSDKDTIMRHVYAYGNITKYYELGDKMSAPLCFQTDDVWTAKFVIRAKYGKHPGIRKSQKLVLKDVYHAEPLNINQENIITLDSHNGWNESMSTIKGLDYRLVETYLSDPKEHEGKVSVFNAIYNRYDQQTGAVSSNMGLLGFMQGVALRTEYAYHDSEENVLLTKLMRDPSVAIEAYKASPKINYGLRVTNNYSNVTQAVKRVVNVSSDGEITTYTLDSSELLENSGWLVYDPDLGSPSSEIKRFKYSHASGTLAITVSVDDYPELPHDVDSFIDAPNPRFVVNIPYGNETVDYPTNANVKPFYETVLVREGASWTRVEWWCRPTGPQIKSVIVNGSVYGGGIGVADEGKTKYTANINIDESDLLKMRFEFNDVSNRTGLDYGSCPQLYKVKVGYKMKSNKPNMVILDSY